MHGTCSVLLVSDRDWLSMDSKTIHYGYYYYPLARVKGSIMKISELSRTTGTPIPTIKYYIREGLLARGTPTATNQADYDESHVQRLRLIRVLREVADLSVATLTQVVAALDH